MEGRVRPTDRRQLGAFGAAIAALHLAGWGGVWWGATHGAPALAGLAGLAYAFGLRHAFDADHIAAIDNTTRKLAAPDRQPFGVGFFFSLGHSTVVFLMTLAIAVATQTMTTEMPHLRAVGGLIGTAVSGAFLYLIGLMNVVVMIDIARAFREARMARGDAASIEARLLQKGVLTRWFGGVFRLVSRPWHMYPVGFLFGLGFDTATEIGLLTTAAVATSQSMPIWAVLSLPVVFAAGMSLMDTVDAVLMCGVYGWAFAHPLRKVFYNLTITGLSAAVALFIGTVELLSLASARTGWWVGVAGWNSQVMGYGVVALFLICWAASVAIWHVGGFDKRWAPAETSASGRGNSPTDR
ncbi:MAG: HoxN/HupN/NixA family nickel/cobalt transporter [Acidobacteria bacterium]|nr:MAG: HoxN/HupN/NixA family nickel/cobalt transporter [Acidobacteriota bacterium]